MDGIFGHRHFRSQIVWKRSSAHNTARGPGAVQDMILSYSKSDKYKWNTVYQAYSPDYIDAFYVHSDSDERRWRRQQLTAPGVVKDGEPGKAWRGVEVTSRGRHWSRPHADLDELDQAGMIHWPRKKGGLPMRKQYLDEQPGCPLQNIWVDIKSIQNTPKEKMGYSTQKPLALLERIISASTNEGDVVLDPFCGCATTLEAAHKLKRKWDRDRHSHTRDKARGGSQARRAL